LRRRGFESYFDKTGEEQNLELILTQLRGELGTNHLVQEKRGTGVWK